jgi:hypothetical protein
MNKFLIAIALSVLSVSGRSETVNWSDIGKSVEIIGRLGVPLGTVVTIEATVISGSELRSFYSLLSMMRFLRVDSIDGVPCENPPVMSFGVYPDPESYTFPADPDDAQKQSERLKMKSPQHAAIGSKFTLFAFESGSTPPNPHDAPEEAWFSYISTSPDPQPSRGTYFRTFLNVVAPKEKPIGIGPPMTERPSHTTTRTDP